MNTALEHSIEDAQDTLWEFRDRYRLQPEETLADLYFVSDLRDGEGDLSPIRLLDLIESSDGPTLTLLGTGDSQTSAGMWSSQADGAVCFNLTFPRKEKVIRTTPAECPVTADGEPVSGFRAPWAVDAEGNAVPTSFRLEGQELVQVVEFNASTVFPVVADPDLGVEWWGHWVRLTRGETRTAANIIANNQGPAVLAGVACGALPGPAALGCGAAVALAYFKFVDPVNRANSAGKCVAINYPWTALSTPQIGWVGISVTTVNCTR